MLLLLAVLALPGAYVGLYYKYVKPDAVITQNTNPENSATITVVASYDFTDSKNAKRAESLFTPVHFIDRLVRPDEWPTNVVLTLPTIEIIEEKSIQPEYIQVKLKMTNSGKHPVWFTGYGTQSPVYKYKFQTAGIGWCGTGLGRHRLMPGTSASFIASVPSQYQSEHIGVAFSYTQQTRALTVWSKSIDAQPLAIKQKTN